MSQSHSDIPKKMQLLLDLTSVINSDLQLNSVLKSIIEAVLIITNSEASSIFLTDSTGEKLVLTLPAGPTKNVFAGAEIPISKGIAGWVATNGKPIIVNDAQNDSRFHGDFNPELFQTENLICVPLQNQSQNTIGVIQAINKKNGEIFDSSEIPIFQALAHQAAIAIENARLNEVRERLLSEVHHRVKNNMAVISALMQIQAMNERDKRLRIKLMDNVARISSMAVVHEQFYQSDSFSEINFTENMQHVLQKIADTIETNTDITISCNSDPHFLNINQAIPCSLLLGELAITMINHASNMADTAEISATIGKVKGDELELTLTFKAKKDISLQSYDESESAQLIQVLSQQAGADLKKHVSSDNILYIIRLAKLDIKGSGNYSFT